MNDLRLPNPKMMDVAVPNNIKIGLSQDEIAKRGWAIEHDELMGLISRPDVAIIDLREQQELDSHGTVPGTLHVPYGGLAQALKPGGMLNALGRTKQLVFLCAFGERSAMAVQAAHKAGLERTLHLNQGLNGGK